MSAFLFPPLGRNRLTFCMRSSRARHSDRFSSRSSGDSLDSGSAAITTEQSLVEGVLTPAMLGNA